MPQSKKRHQSHHQHPQQQHHAPGHHQQGAKSSRLVNAGMILFAIIGLLMSYFISGNDIVWLIAGTLTGGVVGYFFARQMSRTFSK